MTGANAPHVPVLLAEVLDALAIAPGECHVDGTFGAGGYSRAMAEAGAMVFAIDRDPDAIAEGQAVVAASGGRITLVQGEYSRMQGLLAEAGITRVDGITLDIGVSSMQLDRADRGFSFQNDGPLDMRMSQSGMTAAEWLNGADEAEIANVLYRYGEERQSRRVARAIVAASPRIPRPGPSRRSASFSTRSWRSWRRASKPPRRRWRRADVSPSSAFTASRTGS
jgi:16S rRNA (cytosine1402-N4)-methyltransferase